MDDTARAVSATSRAVDRSQRFRDVATAESHDTTAAGPRRLSGSF